MPLFTRFKLGKKAIKNNSVRPRSWLMLLTLGLVWGTSFILIKRGLVAFPPDQVACLRIGITSFVFAPVLFFRRKKIEKRRWIYLLIVGFAGSLIPAFLFALAQTKISSSLAGMLSSLTPLFTLLLGIVFFKVKANWTKIAGVLLGLAGAILMLAGDGGIYAFKEMLYGVLILAGCLFYAISSNVVKTWLSHMPSVVISAVSYAIAGVPAIIYLLFTDFYVILKTHDSAWSSLGYIVVLAVTSTVAASVIYFKLIKDTNALFAATVSYLIPFVALSWGILDGEHLEIYQIAGMAIILGGVYVAGKQVS